MDQQQKQKPVTGQPGKPADRGDVAQPGNEPRTPGGPGSDVRNPAPAPGTGRDPLVHPGDEQDITPDVIAGQERPGTQAVSGQGNAKPK
jgi:hypothetical protein